MLKNFKGGNTFRPKKTFKKGTQAYELHKHAKSTLGAGDVSKAVKLPQGADKRAWYTVNTVDFYNQISLLYGSLSKVCTNESCPLMNAGPKYEYHWKDDVKYKKPTPLSAPAYMEELMNWIQQQLDDPAIFPQDDVSYPKNFEEVIQNIFKRLFRVYAHVYYCHFDTIKQLQEEAHLNTCFKHFYYFVIEFNLIDEKTQMAPLADLIDNLVHKKNQTNTSN